MPDVVEPTPSDPIPKHAVENGGEGVVVPVLDSAALFRGSREVLILHGNHTYRLRITRNGKLILQK